ncbi:putative copper resistance protein D [Saccharothrix coeruleofusca]|uniref:cytochrome c oxidase assembly protein n=1 Tax=Saccharothrix coeruleofusca TaxID=33919 RepID=UPI0027DE3254|nr:cytochrome c oxidase assembly protein [Saccharothrix coeruleofusca]MBP2335649.1 putative copper resistance protein D [Saccharothrix coeruleofusca]
MRVDRAVLLAGGVAAVCVTTVVLAAGDVHGALGDSDPGRVASWLFGVVRLIADAAGSVTAGSLAFAVFAVPAPDARRLTAHAYAAVRLGAGAAVVWAVAAWAAVPLSAGDASGQPPSVVWRHLAGLVGAAEEPKAWLCVAVVATVVAVGARMTLSWPVAVLWCAVAVAGLLPPVVAGHVSVGAWHDVATDAAVWHVPAAAVWVGMLVALRGFLRRPGVADRDRVLRRYHRATLVCLVVLVVSGSAIGLVTAGSDGLMSGYGVLLAIKVAVCAAVPPLRTRWAARLPLGVEVVVLGVALGASVGLAHLVPPSWLVERPSVQQTVLGYELPHPPSAADLLLGWRLDPLLGLGALLLASAYLLGVRVLRRRGDRWQAGRVAAWLAGCAVVLAVTSSGLGRYAPGTFSLHMVSHMALNMLAPALLVLGGPVTLALRALPPAPRAWLVALVHCRAARVVAHPAVAAVVFVASFYVLYFSGLFGEAMRYHWAHQVMNLHFLVSGYVFYWLVVGVDRPPRPLPHLARLGLLFAVMPFHAFFGVILMSGQTVIAETYYRSLSLTWVPDLLTDQRLGGGIAWAAGELPMLVVVIALLRQWAAGDRREAVRLDRHLDSAEDDRLAAYNAMLADLAGRRS